MGVGQPRLDIYERIISRLFENLALFSILKGIAGPHTVTAQTPTDIQGARRRFLKSLSFICDYRKGGDTTTSVALESQKQDVVFWIAANLTPDDRVIGFLTNILEKLRIEPKETEEDRKILRDELMRISVDFAGPRLKKECKLLSRAASYCERYLEANATITQTSGLLDWLHQFSVTGTDSLTLCCTAYNARHDPQMMTLKALNQELQVAPIQTAKTFRAVRHFIGRLAERTRVTTNLVQDSLLLGQLLNSYRIKQVQAPTAASVPPADGLRNLNSILKRILPAGDPRLEDMQSYLAQLDGPMQLEEAIRSMYGEDNGQARVHSEIQMLEEFHRNQRSFVANDRYIACSKLACLCCKFYFRHHPGRFQEPESHQKAYLNWRPLELPGGRDNEHWGHQRLVLAMLSRELSRAVEEQIETQQQPTPWQPDSLTNITETLQSVNLGDFEAGEVFENNDDWSDDSASLAYLNEDELSEGHGDSDSDDDSDGGVGLND